MPFTIRAEYGKIERVRAKIYSLTVSTGLVFMNKKDGGSSWGAFGLFYLVLLIIVTVLDSANGVLRLPYWGMQVGMITLGVGIFILVGLFMPDLSATLGILLAFTVGILTIIPAVLMGLGKIPGMWPHYLFIAVGMAAGSFLTFLFLKFQRKIPGASQSSSEGKDVD